MEITDLNIDGYQSVKRCIDTQSGLHAIIAVHSTVLGPALGGMRLWHYESEKEAMFDVLRLAKGMTYKASCAGLALGGGKSVILGNPAKKTPELFRAMGEFVESFGGSYITAEDVNTKVEDMAEVNSRTEHCVGLAGKSGNPSPKTAWGCFVGLRAALEEVYGTDDLTGKVVALEGAGSVGAIYAKLMADRGAKIIAADIREESARAVAEECGGTVVSPNEIRGIDCDIYAPCALGGSVNKETIPGLKAQIVCGAANNQLLDSDDGHALRERGILYAPDYVVNAGGLINVYNELVSEGYNEQVAMDMMEKIYTNLKEIFAISKEQGICTSDAADRFGDLRINAALEAMQA